MNYCEATEIEVGDTPSLPLSKSSSRERGRRGGRGSKEREQARSATWLAFFPSQSTVR